MDGTGVPSCGRERIVSVSAFVGQFTYKVCPTSKRITVDSVEMYKKRRIEKARAFWV